MVDLMQQAIANVNAQSQEAAAAHQAQVIGGYQGHAQGQSTQTEVGGKREKIISDQWYMGAVKFYNPEKRYGVIDVPPAYQVGDIKYAMMFGNELVGVVPDKGDTCQFQVAHNISRGVVNPSNPYKAVNIKFVNSRGAAQRDLLFQQKNGQVLTGIIDVYDLAKKCGYIRCMELSPEKGGLSLRFLKSQCRDPVEMLEHGAPCYFTLKLTEQLPEAEDVHLVLPNRQMPPPSASTTSSSVGSAASSGLPMPPMPSFSTMSSSVANAQGGQASAESSIGGDAKRQRRSGWDQQTGEGVANAPKVIGPRAGAPRGPIAPNVNATPSQFSTAGNADILDDVALLQAKLLSDLKSPNLNL